MMHITTLKTLKQLNF